MLHEVFLALSGHPSPLFRSADDELVNDNEKVVNENFPLLSSSEAALLQSIGRLALLHRRLRTHAESIASNHASVLCRAVATALVNTHLARFQDKILDVESQILNRDAKTVGAYNIVPLSSVVGELDKWSRPMDWYWQLACFMRKPARGSRSTVSSAHREDEAAGASLIDHLRVESQTGFPDIEEAAVQLSKVAEAAWLRQISVWLLHGNLPEPGTDDFFVTVQGPVDTEGRYTYSVNKRLLPKLVTAQTASSLLFIGKSLHQVKEHSHVTGRQFLVNAADDVALMSSHLRILSSLSLPLVPSSFSATVAAIRSSLSQRVLQHLLPVEDIVRILKLLRQFFLLERGEFALALLAEAELRLTARQDGVGHLLQGGPPRDLRAMMLKEGEITETLARTWKVLAAYTRDDAEDSFLDFAQDHVHLEIAASARSHRSVSDTTASSPLQISAVPFDDILFPVPTALTLNIRSPLDLFITRSDIMKYSSINAYLLAVRRAHVRLSNLWKLSSSRRDMSVVARSSSSIRRRTRQRDIALRKVWATCSSAVFLLSETTVYLERGVIAGSWDHFYQWTLKGNMDDKLSRSVSDVHLNDTSGSGKRLQVLGTPHDPETLASAHRAFLEGLLYALMLTDVPYTTELRRFFTDIDQMIALFTRLQHVQRNLDLEQDEGVIDALNDYAEEEREVSLNLDRARKRVDSGMKNVVLRLRQLDHDRMGAGMYSPASAMNGDACTPWKAGGIDRLLMKLDFGRMTTEDEMVLSG